MSEVKYPEVEVTLLGEDGNAFAILGKVQKALGRYFREIGADREQIRRELEAYREEATAGDYDHLLATTMRWVEVR